MQDLLPNIRIEMPEGIFLKDPETSKLGKKIIEHSIILIEDIGFEDFNFKKLGKLIGSNESSIYRYFESKHKLLIYLTSWYWSWIEYQLLVETYSIEDNKDKLKKAIKVVTRTVKQDGNYIHINEVLLNNIIVSENSKSYLTKKVDLENESGFFMPYKRVVYRIAEIVSANNGSYNHPLSLASTVLEGALHQHYLKYHFKTLTNCDSKNTPTDFFTNLVLNTILIHGE